MALTLDYFRKLPEDVTDNLKIFILVIQDEGGKFNTYEGDSIENCADLLAERTRIITYGNTIRNVYSYMPPQFLEDWEVNKKVFDVFNYLKKLTGHDIALGSLAKGTLDIDAQILRLPKDYDYDNDAEITEKLESRTRYLNEIWEYGMNNGVLYYMRKGISEKVEVCFTDNYDAD